MSPSPSDALSTCAAAQASLHGPATVQDIADYVQRRWVDQTASASDALVIALRCELSGNLGVLTAVEAPFLANWERFAESSRSIMLESINEAAALTARSSLSA